MAISSYFKHISSKNEQNLIASLTAETIFQRGLDLVYIPRTESEAGADYLFGEDPENIYDKGVPIEMYLAEIKDGFGGEDFIGRFGLQLDDNATFIVSIKRFNEEITRRYPDIIRPREGDLILFKVDPSEPMTMFEIKFLAKAPPFYQIGKSTVYRMETERFAYSHETVQTGIPEVDDVNLADHEPYEDNTPIQTEGDTIVDFNENDPFSDGAF